MRGSRACHVPGAAEGPLEDAALQTVEMRGRQEGPGMDPPWVRTAGWLLGLPSWEDSRTKLSTVCGALCLLLAWLCP